MAKNEQLLETIKAADDAWFQAEINGYQSRDRAVQLFRGGTLHAAADAHDNGEAASSHTSHCKDIKKRYYVLINLT